MRRKTKPGEYADALRTSGGDLSYANLKASAGLSRYRAASLLMYMDAAGLTKPHIKHRKRELAVSLAEAVSRVRAAQDIPSYEPDSVDDLGGGPYRLLHDPHGNFEPGTILEACVVETYLEESAIRRNQQTADDWRCVQGLEFESLDGDERFRIYDGQKLEVSDG